MKYKNITQKKGDGGMTDLCMGGRVAKTDSRIKSVGLIDELHATMGLSHQHIPKSVISSNLLSIQRDLTLLMGEITCSDDTKHKYCELFGGIQGFHVNKLDNFLDIAAETLDSRGSSQTGWALYGQRGPASAQLDFAGVVCRKCELSILSLKDDNYNVRTEITQYMNRLSKVLYLFARELEEH